jgi:uncharacterized membrane protein YkvA (DUF1232 family)
MAKLSLFNNKTNALRAYGGALYFALRDPRTPWPAKLIALGVIVYAFSPIDFIPDFIPFIGWIDDAIIIGTGMKLIRWFTPDHVWEEALVKAAPVESMIKKMYTRLLWTLVAVWVVVVLVAAGVVMVFTRALTSVFR